jgi:hypothetical protein
MVLRWPAARMINAERSFRRVKGYKQMPQLVAALYRRAHPDAAAPAETVRWRGERCCTAGGVVLVARQRTRRPAR